MGIGSIIYPYINNFLKMIPATVGMIKILKIVNKIAKGSRWTFLSKAAVPGLS